MNSIQKFGEFLGPHIKFVEHLHKFHLRTCLQHQAACDPPCASLPQICWHMGNFFFPIASDSCKTSVQFVYQEICIYITLCQSVLGILLGKNLLVLPSANLRKLRSFCRLSLLTTSTQLQITNKTLNRQRARASLPG